MKKIPMPKETVTDNDDITELELFEQFEFPLFIEQVSDAAKIHTTPANLLEVMHETFFTGTPHILKGWTPVEVAQALYGYLDEPNGAERIARTILEY